MQKCFLAPLLLALAACGGAVSVLTDPRTQTVEIGPDTFYVLIEDEVATVSTFESGFNTQLRLREGAKAAIATQTDCEITGFFQFEAVTKYQARLVC